MFGVGIMAPRKIALSLFVFLVPLAPTLSNQITIYTGISLWSSQVIMGFDLAASYFLAIFCKHVIYSIAARRSGGMESLKSSWPINWVILIISLSTMLAVMRNAWHSAAPLAMGGIGLSLMGARGIDWYDDLRPLVDWMAYTLAGAVVILVGSTLRTTLERNQYIFRPMIAGLLLSGLLALIQSRTGLGLNNSPILDSFGYAAIGFQPDLHAFAAYTLLGGLGLWGYFSSCKSRTEKGLIVVVAALSGAALLLSYSRATQLIALTTLLIFIICRAFDKKNKIFRMRSFVGLALLMLMGGTLIFFFQQEILALIPQRNLAFFKSLNAIDLSNFTQINAALSDRPAIWSVALRMWQSFPIFGVGQGNFYQLSPLFNFENFPILSSGENTHNYFLQTLVETGLIGAVAFVIAIGAPFFLVKERRVLMPAVIALFSLFLGNIYAHSFLVRENLLLAAVLLGLMYSYVTQEKFVLSPHHFFRNANAPLPRKWITSISCLVIVGFGAREIYNSFYHFPFVYGSACFINKPLSKDRWSSGLYEIPLPIGSHGVLLAIRVARPNLQHVPLLATFEIIDTSKQMLASRALEWHDNGPYMVDISLPNGAVNLDAGVKASLRLSSCYTPRNLGDSIDGRRLGILIDSSIIY